MNGLPTPSPRPEFLTGPMSRTVALEEAQRTLPEDSIRVRTTYCPGERDTPSLQLRQHMLPVPVIYGMMPAYPMYPYASHAQADHQLQPHLHEFHRPPPSYPYFSLPPEALSYQNNSAHLLQHPGYQDFSRPRSYPIPPQPQPNPNTVTQSPEPLNPEVEEDNIVVSRNPARAVGSVPLPRTQTEYLHTASRGSVMQEPAQMQPLIGLPSAAPAQPSFARSSEVFPAVRAGASPQATNGADVERPEEQSVPADTAIQQTPQRNQQANSLGMVFKKGLYARDRNPRRAATNAYREPPTPPTKTVRKRSLQTEPSTPQTSNKKVKRSANTTVKKPRAKSTISLGPLKRESRRTRSVSATRAEVVPSNEAPPQDTVPQEAPPEKAAPGKAAPVEAAPGEARKPRANSSQTSKKEPRRTASASATPAVENRSNEEPPRQAPPAEAPLQEASLQEAHLQEAPLQEATLQKATLQEKASPQEALAREASPVDPTISKTRPTREQAGDEKFVQDVLSALEPQMKRKVPDMGKRQANRISTLLKKARYADPSEAKFLSTDEAMETVSTNKFFNGIIVTTNQQTLPLQTVEGFLDEYYEDNAEVWIQDPAVRPSKNAEITRKVRMRAIRERFARKPSMQPWNCLELATHCDDGLRPSFLNTEDCRLLTKVKIPNSADQARRRMYESGYKEVEKWALLAQAGALTEPHQDSHGYSTFITVNVGLVGFGWLSFPTEQERADWRADPMDYTGGNWRYIVLKPGQTIYFPAGTVHFVFRLASEGNTLAFGGHILRCSNIVHWVKTLIEERDQKNVTNEDLTDSATGYLERVEKFVKQAVANGRAEKWGGTENIEEFLRLKEEFGRVRQR